MNVKNLKQKVRSALSSSEFTSTRDVAALCGITPANALYYLEILAESGEAERRNMIVRHVDSNASSRRYAYRLATPRPPELPAPPTPAAYRNLRLTENLTGYESTLHNFAALCMLVRK